ncbi:hypothetical protein [Fimbriimonas ginsengisoli]|uniref:Uncharacterized protein n=1 Tax=Fimbriimonas ginsengisoli Gsoil 348 TaxID=661478 RepID=A0A068NSJ0_FIMGI|nr:hypothetical protein [Fimbriimonas ginsengisoli]AIE86411.1 hypothetical protein OP10G_3043 [Fimbriimonas ginsengisoli Gsoil 348]
MRARLASVLTVLVLLISVLALSGCGGGGGASASGAKSGAFRLTIKWPSLGRVVPKLATRLHLLVKEDGSDTPLKEVDVTRPSGTNDQSIVVFDGLPLSKPLFLQCKAFGTVSGSDVILGEASTAVTVAPGAVNVAVLDLVSTIDHLDVRVGTFPSGDVHIHRKDIFAVGVTALDSSGSLIPIGPNNLTVTGGSTAFNLTPKDGGGYTLTASQTLLGDGVLTFKEAESGKQLQVHVFVDKRPGVQRVEILPSKAFNIIHGDSMTVGAKGFDEDNVLVSGASFTFALQNATGLALAGTTLTAPGAGGGTVVATETQNGFSDSATVTILPHGFAERLAALDSSGAEIGAGGLDVQSPSTTQLSAASFDRFNNKAEVPTGQVWTSDDPDFVIDNTGKLTVKPGILFGTATITLKATIQTATGPQQMTVQFDVHASSGGG